MAIWSKRSRPRRRRAYHQGGKACRVIATSLLEAVVDLDFPAVWRGILEAIYWKPAILRVIEAIEVLKPIRFQSIRRNDVGHKAPAASIRRAMNSGDIGDLAPIVEDGRQQRAATVLVDVAYVIRALRTHRESRTRRQRGQAPRLVEPPRSQGAMFPSAMPRHGRVPAKFRLIESGESPPLMIGETRDLGFMLYDVDPGSDRTSPFFCAALKDGALGVPPPGSAEIRR
jgi:CRISPR-associated protein Cas5d